MMQKMSLVEFMLWFYESQDKQWLINELIKHEMMGKENEWFKQYWVTLADQCVVELVNV